MKPPAPLHPTHKTHPKPLSKWLYCGKCGLMYLKNDATRRAMRVRCEALDD